MSKLSLLLMLLLLLLSLLVVAAAMAVVFVLGFWKRKILDSLINYWIAIWLYCRSGKSMKIRIMVSLIKICVNMDEEKSREKQAKTKRKTKGRGGGKRKRKRIEKGQLTLGQCVGPTNSWKILSDDKWVMVPNGVGCFKWWVMSDGWWVMSDGNWVRSDE